MQSYIAERLKLPNVIRMKYTDFQSGDDAMKNKCRYNKNLLYKQKSDLNLDAV